MIGLHLSAVRDIIPKDTARYRSFPVMMKNGEKGSLLVMYRDAKSNPDTFSHGLEGDMMLMSRTDGKWGEPEPLYKHTDEAEEMGGNFTRLKDGTILLYSRQWDGKTSVGSYMARSTDDGRTFESRKLVDIPEFTGRWCMYGKILEFNSGLLVLGACKRRKGEDDFEAGCIASDDQGRNWKFYSWVAPAGTTVGRYGCSEILLLRLRNNSLLALLRTEPFLSLARSFDEGKTWSTPEVGFEGMACAALVLETGRILVTYRGIHPEPDDREGKKLFRREGRLYCCRWSDDNGATWSDEYEIDGNTAIQVGSYGMGDIVEETDGRIRVIYYTSDVDQAPWIQERILTLPD